MTKKDYVAIARAMKAARVTNYAGDDRRGLYLNGVDNAASRLADELARDNPRFNRDLFLKACGVQ